MLFTEPVNVNTPEELETVDKVLSQLKDLEFRQRCRTIYEALSIDPRVQMSHNEFRELCKLHGLNENECRDLSYTLHNAGLIWYFPGYFEVQNPIILKPNTVTKKFLEILDLKGEMRDEFIKQKQAELIKKVYVIIL